MEITGFPTERRVWAETKGAKTRPSERQVHFYVWREGRQGRGGTGKNEAKKVKGGQVLWVLRPPSGGFTESEGRHRSASRQAFLGMVAPRPPSFRTRRCAEQGPPRRAAASSSPLPRLGHEEPGALPRRQGSVRGTLRQRTAGWNGPGRGDDGTLRRPQPGLSLQPRPPAHGGRPRPSTETVPRTSHKTAGGRPGSSATRPAVRARGGPETPGRRRT